MINTRLALGAIALALAASLSACGTDDGPPTAEPTPSKSPTTVASTSAAPSTPGQLATAQLQKYLAVRDLAYQQRNIDFKTLNPVATGNEFLALQKSVVDLRKASATKTGRYVHTLGESRDLGATIQITDCENRSGVTIRVKGKVRTPDYVTPDGKPLRNPVPVKYTLVTDKGVWKVSDSDLLWKQPC